MVPQTGPHGVKRAKTSRTPAGCHYIEQCLTCPNTRNQSASPSGLVIKGCASPWATIKDRDPRLSKCLPFGQEYFHAIALNGCVGQSHETNLRPAASGRRAIRREPLAREANFEGQLVIFVQVNPRQRLASHQRTAGGRRSQVSCDCPHPKFTKLPHFPPNL